LVVALAFLTGGCVRRPEFTAGQPGTTQEHTLPFQEAGSHAPVTPAAAFSLSDLAMGTPLLVHLQAPLSSAHGRAGNTFQAILDEPILLSGQTIASKGAIVIGKILEAKPSDPVHEAGYLRLTLTGISLNGESWSLQTSRVFVKGATYQREAAVAPVQLAAASTSLTASGVPATRIVQVHEDAGVPADRLLIFRLSQTHRVRNAGGQ
jgi:hypothetical protein